ncbi:hypothetical protein [Nostoc sp. NMS9]|uniref:hypothetical protein n=1 Tax=Nostoc sp. NMS9 TaxID=2815393 RepID=UPI0025E4DAE6|nr:hypothetical protein [Nostoc sp. NMS9]MBN3941584.1 hypothetical protein [Nostoc sp. NMS9]
MEFLEFDETLTLEDKLSSLSADLVSGENIFLSRLFTYPSGIPIDLDELCTSLEIEPELQEIRGEFKGKIIVTWIDYPNAEFQEYSAIILFLAESIFWNQIALYNKRLFEEKQ